MLWYKHEVKGIRGLAMGIKRSHQKLGLPLVAFNHVLKLFWERYEYMEFGWNLEDNYDITSFEMELGAKIYKKYRIFRKELS